MSAIDLGCFLRKRMSTLNISVSCVCRDSGISRQTFQKLLNAEIKDAKLSTIVRIADSLKVEVLDVISIYIK